MTESKSNGVYNLQSNISLSAEIIIVCMQTKRYGREREREREDNSYPSLHILPRLQPLELRMIFRVNVLQVKFDVVVTVRASVFMVEADCMTKLMNDRPDMGATWLNQVRI